MLFPATFIPKLIKLVAPGLTDIITEHIVKIFKLDKVLNYMELPNDADNRIDALEAQIKMVAEDSHPMQPFDDRITKLEEFAKQVSRKKAFKRKDGE